MASGQYSLCWDKFQHNMTSSMNALLENEDLVDVTLAVEGRYLKAHKMVLSICSLYFQDLFKVTPCKHPIVFLKDVSYTVMNCLLRFMYQGEVQVSQGHLTAFIKTAEALQIKGLTDDGNGLMEYGEKVHQEEGKMVENEMLKVSSVDQNNQPKKPSSPALKKPRLEQITPFQTSVVKTEPITDEITGIATTAPSDEQLVLFKIEPCDQDQSLDTIGDDNFDDNFIDDTVDINEEYTMMESGDEELKEGPSTGGVGEDSQDSVAITAIPEKSKERYEQVYMKFEEWCLQKNEKEILEPVVLAYFQEKAKTQKSSTLWCYYSMLRTVIFIKKEIDIKNYSTLMAFLKCLPKGFKTRKSKIFTKQDIDKFLKEANDKTYLMMKVVLVLGIAGSCKRDELTYMRTDDIRDEGNYIQITIPTRKMGDEREFILTDGTIEGYSLLEMFRKYVNLRRAKTDHKRFFVNYRNGQCTVQPVGVHTIGSVPSKIAEFLGLENPRDYTLRKLSPLLLDRRFRQVRFF